MQKELESIIPPYMSMQTSPIELISFSKHVVKGQSNIAAVLLWNPELQPLFSHKEGGNPLQEWRL
jgi:hypothetical protein